MFRVDKTYLERARQSEAIFRNILRNFSSELLEQVDLDPETELESIFNRHSLGNRIGKWTILDFRIGPFRSQRFEIGKDEAYLESGMVKPDGFGAVRTYEIRSDQTVEFKKAYSLN